MVTAVTLATMATASVNGSCVVGRRSHAKRAENAAERIFFVSVIVIFFLRVRYGAQYWEKGEVAIVPAPIPVAECVSAVWGVPVNAAGIAGGIASSDEPPH